MDPIKRFGDLEIPREVSFIISDYIYCWTKCDKCDIERPLEYFQACGRQTANCWYCRKKNKGCLRKRWMRYLGKRTRWRTPTVYNMDSHIFHGHIEWPYWANVFACYVYTCPVLEYIDAMESFKHIIGIPKEIYNRDVRTIGMGGSVGELYEYLNV